MLRPSWTIKFASSTTTLVTVPHRKVKPTRCSSHSSPMTGPALMACSTGQRPTSRRGILRLTCRHGCGGGGRKDKGGGLDSNSASVADVWMAFKLLRAGMAWIERHDILL